MNPLIHFKEATPALVGRAVLCTPFRWQLTKIGAHGSGTPYLYAPYRAARLISSRDAGFSKAEVSPSFSPR
jgi:hypothetical protein